MQNPAQSLLVEYLNPKPEGHILILEGENGDLAREVARLIPEGEVLSLARDVREVWAAQAQTESVPNAAATFDVFPKTGNWDIVLLTIPKERRYTRTLLLAAWKALKPGGRLLLAGPSKTGAKAMIKDAERLFGHAVVLGYRHHQRVAACIRGDTLPDPLPEEFQQAGIAPGTRHFLEVTRPEGTLKLETHPGIFSWEVLDEGTALLLEHLKIDPGSRVWDVGCGYGVIGLSAALAGAGSVVMSDVNLVGVDYAKRNAIKNGLSEQVQVLPIDGLRVALNSQRTTHNFNLIVSNPAFHQGHQVDKSMADAMIARASDFLSPGGRFLLVANRFLNYDKSMRAYFGQVSKLAETTRYHLIEASQ